MSNMLLPRKTTLHHSEEGMVSMLTTMIMMIVISLVVIGFSQLSSNEVTQALNRQLSTEAFYAADSGIDNANSIINQDLNTDQAVGAQTNSCTGSYTSNGILSPGSGSSSNVAYTCVTVDPTPTSLNPSIGAGESQVFPIDGINLASSGLQISWTNPDAPSDPSIGNCPTSVGELPPAASWSSNLSPCPLGALQVDLIPSSALSPSASGASTDPFINQEEATYDLFLLPHASGGSVALPENPSDSSLVYGADCSNTSCQANIAFTDAPAGDYYLRVMSIYDESSVTIRASGQQFHNAVADVDATGKAQDVLQRLSESYPISGLSGDTPEFAIQSGDGICKLIEGYPANGTSPAVVDWGTSNLFSQSGVPAQQKQQAEADAANGCSFTDPHTGW